MAKQLDFELAPGVMVSDAYLMVGSTEINHYHETVTLSIYVFSSQAARITDPSDPLFDPTIEPDARRPIKIIQVQPLFADYISYLEGDSDVLTTSVYSLISEIPEGNATLPAGLQTLLVDAINIGPGMLEARDGFALSDAAATALA